MIRLLTELKNESGPRGLLQTQAHGLYQQHKLDSMELKEYEPIDVISLFHD